MPYDLLATAVFSREGTYFDLLLQEAHGGLSVAEVTAVCPGDAERAPHSLDAWPGHV